MRSKNTGEEAARSAFAGILLFVFPAWIWYELTLNRASAKSGLLTGLVFLAIALLVRLASANELVDVATIIFGFLPGIPMTTIAAFRWLSARSAATGDA